VRREGRKSVSGRGTEKGKERRKKKGREIGIGITTEAEIGTEKGTEKGNAIETETGIETGRKEEKETGTGTEAVKVSERGEEAISIPNIHMEGLILDPWMLNTLLHPIFPSSLLPPNHSPLSPPRDTGGTMAMEIPTINSFPLSVLG
jgi:hypothetical protein